jgi:small subunit ribosomal protein S11
MAEENQKNNSPDADSSEEQKPQQEAGEATQTAEAAPETAAKGGKGKRRRTVSSTGIVHIKATFNNTQVSITDSRGNMVAWSSAGKVGFKGSRKSTAFAATLVCQDAARTAASRGMREVEVKVQGAGSGRESAIRALQSVGMNVSTIKDVTSIPHNGCRPRKRRRV